MKQYLADGVYAELANGELVLTTENGISIQNTIVFEPYTLVAFFEFLMQNTNVVVTWPSTRGAGDVDGP